MVYILWGERMKKLTPEQAQWLIDEIQKLESRIAFSPAHNSPALCAPLCDIVQKINQCTEKEFPNFEINDDGEIVKVEENLAHGTICIEIPDGVIGLSVKKFKEFAAAVNKIVGWLDEQENS